MKFVAKVPFHNAPELNLDLKGKTAHPMQVPRGYQFEIAPDAKSLKGVVKESDKQLISKLVMFDLVVVDDGSPESKDAIEAVNKLAADEKRLAAIKPAEVK